MTRVARFLVVGAVGFLADAGMLALLTAWLGIGPLLARIGSIAFALGVTWMLNRHVTFGPSRRAIALEGARYGGVGIGTSLINYSVYSGLMLAIPALPPVAALAVASVAAMALSYLGYSRLVFNA